LLQFTPTPDFATIYEHSVWIATIDAHILAHDSHYFGVGVKSNNNLPYFVTVP